MTQKELDKKGKTKMSEGSKDDYNRYFRELMKKANENKPHPLAVWKIVAVKNGVETVFTMPGLSGEQLQRSLMIRGWDYIAGVEFNTPQEAGKMSTEEIKLQGLPAGGTG